MSIRKALWISIIQEQLFKDGTFLNFFKDQSDFVKEGKFLYLPQAGAKPNVVRNRSSLPATVTIRTDVASVIELAAFTTDPTLIENIDQYELSYNKMASVLSSHIKTLEEVIEDYALIDVVKTFAFTGAQTTSAADVIRTTGGAVAAHLPSATGNRKKFLKEDLKKAQFTMNKSNIAKGNRYAVFSSDLLDQLHDDADLKKRDSSLELDMRNGVIERLYGFNIIERSTTATYNNASTPVVKAFGAAAAGTDNDSVICWQMDHALKAKGAVDFFENLNDATYYGDVYSAQLRYGALKARADGKGVIAIVQDASA